MVVKIAEDQGVTKWTNCDIACTFFSIIENGIGRFHMKKLKEIGIMLVLKWSMVLWFHGIFRWNLDTEIYLNV